MADKPRTRRRRRDDDTPETPPEAAEPAKAEAKPKPAPRRGHVDQRDGRRAFDPRASRAPKPAKQDTSPTPGGLAELEAFAKMGEVDMDALLGAVGSTKLPEPGSRVTGTVTGLGPRGAHVDIGARSAAWIATAESGELAPGDTVEAFVVSADDTGVVLSTKLTGEAAAVHLEDALEAEIPVEGRVVSRNRGGYTVKVGPISAFCPISQMSRLPLADPDSVIGEELSFRVLETGDKVVLSRRVLEEADLDEAREARWASLQEGSVVDAVVTGVQSWAAFLDVDGVELMLPKREHGWDDVDDLTTVLERGQRLTVRVARIADDRGRTVVTTRDPDLDPWRTITSTFPPGKVVEGRVVNQTDFGVFVELMPGVQGLVHRTRLAARLPDPGTPLEVRVLSVDPERRRLELAPSDFDPEAQAANPVGAEVTGEIVEVASAGLAVRLEDGRRAWLPAREADVEPGVLLAQRFRAGHAVTARIAREDPRRDRVVLTQKAPEDDGWRDQLKTSSSQGGGGLGTLGDLLSGWKKD